MAPSAFVRTVLWAYAAVAVCTPLLADSLYLELIVAPHQAVPAAIRDAAVAEAARVWAPYGLTIAHRPAACGGGGRRLTVTFDLGGGAAGDGGLDGHDGLGSIRFGSNGVPDASVTLHYDAVVRLASSANVMGWSAAQWPAGMRDEIVARTLGRTLAHEIGHFVLRWPHHPGAGLMQARQRASVLAARNPAPFLLTSIDEARLRIVTLAGEAVTGIGQRPPACAG